MPDSREMSAKGPADMTSLREYPRVRPALWLLLPIFIGAAILEVGARQAWFVGALGSETYPKLKFALSWAILGLAFSVLSIVVWALLTRRARKWKAWLAPLLVCAFMVAGSQFAAQHASDRLVLVIDGIRWDDEAKEFMLHALAAPSVARAYKRGELEATASAETWSIGTSGVRSMASQPGEGLAQTTLRDLREDTATPPSAHLYGVELVELGWIPASWNRGPDGTIWIHGLSTSEAPGYLPLTAKVTFVNRAQQPIGRTAGAAFWLPCGTDPPFFPNDHEISALIRRIRSSTPPDKQDE